MITPDRLNEITAASEEALASFNSALCDKIAARVQATFKRDGEASLNPSSVNDIHKMMVAGMVAEDIQKEIAKRIPFLDEEVEKAFKNSAKEIGASLNDASVKLANANGVKASVNADLTTHEQKLLEADYRLTKGTMHNLTRTTVTAGQEAFIKACDDAMFQVQRGVSLDKAITDAIKKMAQAGITTVDYKSGRKDRVEVALARAIRTGINKANADLTLQRCAELGVSYVRVSQHVGARVTNNDDYTNHSWWQGQVYKVDWSKPEFAQYSPNIPEKDKQNWGWLGKLREKTRDLYLESTYKDFVEVCGFGKLLGICGINCRHTFSPFFVGINENTDKHINEAENEKRYKETQTQRAYERNIRAIKREISALENLSIHTEDDIKDIGSLKRDLAFFRKKYKEYIKEHNLSEAGWRTDTPVKKEHDIKFYQITHNNSPYDYKITKTNTITVKGETYTVDGTNVMFEFRKGEDNYAHDIGKAIGGKIELIPKVCGKYKHVHTPDYYIDGVAWDLKCLDGNSKEGVRNAVKGSQEQACKFIIMIRNEELETDSVLEQAQKVFYGYFNTTFVEELIVMRGNELIAHYKKL